MSDDKTFPIDYTVENIEQHVGRTFGPSTPVTVDQDRIQGFADVTGDQQWIHVDVEKAEKHSPFGGPIAHGYLTLSLLAAAQMGLGIVPDGCKGVMNYGLDKVRFLAPVPSGAAVEVSAILTGVEVKSGGRILIRSTVTARVAGQEDPALIAETLAMAFT
ncbi:MaoC family dehydratase [Ruegeria lacuscaerulensis]|uniref:MaoC family dehydratase n=1 Tax=Ruegeria lacuscaerulensis TaxID=55218 RepID=UPI00147DE86F|nr:MaoC family dehydratase [Ruegeria lacuscaerulensis]